MLRCPSCGETRPECFAPWARKRNTTTNYCSECDKKIGPKVKSRDGIGDMHRGTLIRQMTEDPEIMHDVLVNGVESWRV